MRARTLFVLLLFALPAALRGDDDLPDGARKRLVVNEDGEGVLFCVAWSPDGKTLACGGSLKRVHLFDVASGELLRSFGSHIDNVWTVAWSPDGKLMCSGGRADLTLRAWDPAKGSELRPFEGHHGGITRIQFFPDGKRVIMSGGSWDPTIRVWDVERREQLLALTGHGDYIDSMDLARHGRLALSGSRDGSLRLWDLTRGNEVWFLRASEEDRGFNSVSFSPDARLFAAGSSAGEFQVRETLTRRRCLPASERNGAVYATAFSPDGRLVAFTSQTRLVVLWDARTGKEVRTFRGHRAQIHGLAFSPDGKLLATSAADNTVLLWDVPAAADLRRRLGDEERVKQVELLASDNAVLARLALTALAGDTGPVHALIEQRLKPSVAGDVASYERWIPQLASASYSERERATQELERAGEKADGTLRRAWIQSKLAEQRRRVGRLLDRLDREIPSGEALWQIRAVALLEARADADARRLLRLLAAGAPSRLTTEAAEALERLGK